MSRDLGYRPDIDGLRALAVMLVVLNHAGVDRLPGGFIGVDVFFVISGFLITGIIAGQRERGDFRFGDFYLRRARRLLPALFVLLFVVTAIGYVVLIPSDYSLVGQGALSAVALSPTSSSPGRRGATSRRRPAPSRSCTSGRCRWRSSST